MFMRHPYKLVTPLIYPSTPPEAIPPVRWIFAPFLRVIVGLLVADEFTLNLVPLRCKSQPSKTKSVDNVMICNVYV